MHDCEDIDVLKKIHEMNGPHKRPISTRLKTFEMNLTIVCGCIQTQNTLILFQKLHEEWNKFTLDDIKPLIESKSHRCAAVIAAKDMFTKN